MQNNLFKISIADTLPFKPDELKAYYTNRIRQTYPNDSTRQKELEFLQREIDIGRIHLVFDDDWFYEPWGQINTTEIESLRNSEFRPQVSFPNKKIVYLTDGYKKMLDDFLGDQHVDLGTESIMQVAYAKDESRQRMEFLMKAAKIFYGHWGGYWQYETYPKANQIIFDREMQRAVVFFRCVYEGGEVYLEKKDGEWTIVSGKLTWIE